MRINRRARTHPIGRAASAAVPAPAALLAVLAGLWLMAPAPAMAAPSRASAPAGSTRWLGAAPPNGSVSLALPLHADLAGLQRFAAAVTTPGSPQYRHYESIAQLSRRFGASPAIRARVLRYLRAKGATGVRIDVTGLFADAELKVATAQRLFGTALAEFRTARAAAYMAPAAPTEIPAALRPAVTGVIGLDTQPLFGSSHALARPARWPHTAATRAPEHAYVQSGYPQRTGTPSGCTAATSQSGFTPNQYLTAYGYQPLQGAGLQGQGERVALIEIDGFKASDLHRFAQCFGLAVPAINGYGVGLRHPLAPGGESTLDLEVLDAAAPRLKAVDVYESRPSAVDVLHSLTAPLANGNSRPDVISASLGSCEPATLETIGFSGLRMVEGSLSMAAASGISVLASSGDAGSSSCLDSSGRPLPDLAVSYPASSPWVTGVGGTNVTLNPLNQITSQQVWNDSPLVVAAGGGGLSTLFRRPGFQSGFVGGGRRAVPDVSMLADVAPGYEIYCSARSDCLDQQHGSPWTQVGGTSAAAPLLAGGLALVDQGLRQHGRQNIGLANPLLYTIARSPGAGSVISDVTTNDNDLGDAIDGHPLGCCSAGPGFDYASGLGSVNLSGLAAAAGALIPRIARIGISVPRQRHPVAARRLQARVSCSTRCLAGAYAGIQIGRARRAIVRRSPAYLLRGAGRRLATIGLDPGTLARLRRALARHQRVTATLYATILDPSGQVEARSRGVTLRITG